MVTLIIVGVLAWALKEAAEDVIRTVRGDPPPSPRKGFRGYVEDRWNALAERHHRAEEAGLISHLDARAYKRHLARREALKRAGFKTEEDLARAVIEHRRRMALIEQGIDPDARPEAAEPEQTEPEPAPEPEAEPIPEPGISIDGHFYDNVQVWLNPEYFPPEPNPDQAKATDDKPWDPFAPTDNDNKENSMSNNGEITGPADVKQFHDDLNAVLGETGTLADVLQSRSSELQARVDNVAANITATETAAEGMRRLGMTAAAEAADALMEVQASVHDVLLQLRLAHDTAVSELTDQDGAAEAHLAAIHTAYEGQLAVQDARAGAGHGNLATDDFLDNND